jgi:hypothetical protein
MPGGWKTREMVETRIRWEPRLGQLTRHYDNIVAPALEDTSTLTTRIGPTERKQTTAYEPAALSQAAIRIPDLHPENAWPQAQAALHQPRDECRQAAQSPHLRHYAIHAAHANLHGPSRLQPMYATYYLDDQGRPQVVPLTPGRAVPSAGCRFLVSARPAAGHRPVRLSLAVYLAPYSCC